MKIEYDILKNAKNIEERGLPFDLAKDLKWSSAVIWQDARFEYGEIRWNALAFLDERLHNVVFKQIEGGIRVISFRKANKREMIKYERERRI